MRSTTALVLFVLGALGGLVMAFHSFRENAIPYILTIGQGLLVASGLIMLLRVVLNGTEGSLATLALVILAIAALGEFYLVRFHINKQTHPLTALVIHALAAVIGVGFLIGSIFS